MSAAVAKPRLMAAGLESEHAAAVPRVAYELCFHNLADTACALSFPCDAAGRVDLDALSEQARHDYLYARAVIGRVFGRPAVRAH